MRRVSCYQVFGGLGLSFLFGAGFPGSKDRLCLCDDDIHPVDKFAVRSLAVDENECVHSCAQGAESLVGDDAFLFHNTDFMSGGSGSTGCIGGAESVVTFVYLCYQQC